VDTRQRPFGGELGYCPGGNRGVASQMGWRPPCADYEATPLRGVASFVYEAFKGNSS
jgi:hypothetical protein